MAQRDLSITVPKALTMHLDAVYGIMVYTQVPQHFDRPCFVVRLVEMTEKRQNAFRRQIRSFVSITYHGESSQDNWRMAADLLETIELIPVDGALPMRAYQKTAQESDGSLVVTAWYHFEIVDVPKLDPMEELVTDVQTEE